MSTPDQPYVPDPKGSPDDGDDRRDGDHPNGGSAVVSAGPERALDLHAAAFGVPLAQTKSRHYQQAQIFAGLNVRPDTAGHPTWNQECALLMARFALAAASLGGIGWAVDPRAYGNAIDVAHRSVPLDPNPATARIGDKHYFNIGLYGHVGDELTGTGHSDGGQDVFMATGNLREAWQPYLGVNSVWGYAAMTGATYLGHSTYDGGIYNLPADPITQQAGDSDMLIYEDGGSGSTPVNTGKFYAGAPGLWQLINNADFGGDAYVRGVLTAAWNAPILMWHGDLVNIGKQYVRAVPTVAGGGGAVNLQPVLDAIAALDKQDDEYETKLEAILAKGLTGTINIAPPK